MTAPRDPDRLIHDFVLEGADQLQDQVYDAVRAAIERKRQRVVVGPWRLPNMNKLVPIGLAAAAVAVAVVFGLRQFAPPQSGVGTIPSAAPSTAPSQQAGPSATLGPTRSPSVVSGLPTGPFVLSGAGEPVRVSFNIASPGGQPLAGLDALTKNDDSLDPPNTVGAALLAWTWPAGTRFNVYGDPCKWLTTIPKTPATTPAKIVAAFAAQKLTEATAPVDVTVGGKAGKAITLHVPMSFDLPGASREERFAECDNDIFAFYGIVGETGEARNAQGAGQVDELWILDVGGSIVILDATYSPATPSELVAETRAMAQSATFATP
jgi:hypothetical protein